MVMRAGSVLIGLLVLAGAARAEQTDVMLEVTGRIAQSMVTFDRDAIEAMTPVTIDTSTVVTDGVHRFTGFLMRDLLGQLEAEGEYITATALNDYAVDIPITDFYDYDVIVAYRMDGAILERADKGPLWIVYPRDAHLDLQDIRYDYRWVWQLYQLDVR